MTPRRVAVTGIGVICGAGNTRPEFQQAMREGRSGIGPLEGFEGVRFSNGARIKDYQPLQHFTEKEIDMLDPFAQYGMIAAKEAILDSGLTWTESLKQDTGVITGSCTGGKLTEDIGFKEIYGEKRPRCNPMTIPRTMANSAASWITMRYGFTGASFTFATACSSSNHALASAFWMVRQGQLEVAIAGGSEAPFTYGNLKAWEAMRVVAPDTCRPFSKDRKGLILGEGAALFVLEAFDAAQARGAHIYGEIVGAGMNADAHHITMPSPEGAAHAMRLALRDASLAPEQIGYINAHGTGTPANDSTETKAIRLLFGEHADRLAISSSKSMHGHALGAAGALEAAATVLSLHAGVIPPTANFNEPDPLCDLDVIPNQSRVADVEYALSNSFAFGGLNAVIAFRNVK